MSDDFQTPPPAPPAPPAQAPAGTEGPSDTGKILAGIGYLTGIVALIAILIEPYKDEKFVRVHAFQALALYVVMIAASVLNVIPILGQIIWLVASIAVFVFAIIGAIKAFQGQEYEMPVIYGFIKNYI
ncbi:DUF4870 domain-containing protein [Anaerosoma tenue]|uniref:DUF4870 domain-containing protein n=1 Tax=Anaerosoma tenue TaxID=2933588 RepID=UPI0022608A17|nr:DUF4870 domain-containing protein [Anaerosoma tenue]MCK8114918.1 DUF4870 domain-containing protein [Anaerosoma tenue]